MAKSDDFKAKRPDVCVWCVTFEYRACMSDTLDTLRNVPNLPKEARGAASVLKLHKAQQNFPVRPSPCLQRQTLFASKPVLILPRAKAASLGRENRWESSSIYWILASNKINRNGTTYTCTSMSSINLGPSTTANHNYKNLDRFHVSTCFNFRR